MAMTMDELRKIIHAEIDKKIDLAVTEAGRLDETRKLVETKLEELKESATTEAKTFWKAHGKVVIVAGCIGLAVGCVVALLLLKIFF